MLCNGQFIGANDAAQGIQEASCYQCIATASSLGPTTPLSATRRPPGGLLAAYQCIFIIHYSLSSYSGKTWAASAS